MYPCSVEPVFKDQWLYKSIPISGLKLEGSLYLPLFSSLDLCVLTPIPTFELYGSVMFDEHSNHVQISPRRRQDQWGFFVFPRAQFLADLGAIFYQHLSYTLM